MSKTDRIFTAIFGCAWIVGAIHTLYIYLTSGEYAVLQIRFEICAFVLIWSLLSKIKRKYGGIIIWLICAFLFLDIIDKFPELQTVSDIEYCYETQDCEKVKDIPWMDEYIRKRESSSTEK